MGKWGMEWGIQFWGFGNKYKIRVVNLVFSYIQIFKIIKDIKVKDISHLSTNSDPLLRY